MIDYVAGDLVECVYGVTTAGNSCGDSRIVAVGQILRATELFECHDDVDPDPLSVWFDAKPYRAYPAHAFRKLLKADAGFTLRMRACQPHKVSA